MLSEIVWRLGHERRIPEVCGSGFAYGPLSEIDGLEVRQLLPSTARRFDARDLSSRPDAVLDLEGQSQH